MNEEKVFDSKLDKDAIYPYGRKVFMLTKNGDYNNPKCDVIELDATTGTVKTLIEGVKEITDLLKGCKDISLLRMIYLFTS